MGGGVYVIVDRAISTNTSPRRRGFPDLRRGLLHVDTAPGMGRFGPERRRPTTAPNAFAER
jgi:hypothetical protein